MKTNNPYQLSINLSQLSDIFNLRDDLKYNLQQQTTYNNKNSLQPQYIRHFKSKDTKHMPTIDFYHFNPTPDS